MCRLLCFCLQKCNFVTKMLMYIISGFIDMIWYDLAILTLSSMATSSPWYGSITVLSSFKCVSLLSVWDNNGLLYRMLLAFRTQLLTLFVAVKCLLLPFKFIIKQLFTVLFTSRSHDISIFNSYWPHVTKAFIFFNLYVLILKIPNWLVYYFHI